MTRSLSVLPLASAMALGTTAAFHTAPLLKAMHASTALHMSDMVEPAPGDATLSSSRIYDPLGLYPENSEERQNGQVRVLEPEVNARRPVFDPMNLYPKNAATDNDAVMSESLPFMTRPLQLQGALPGDVGFDPLGLADSEEKLMNLREAEIKHARLAMLAAAGWPLAELFNKQLAQALHLKPLLGFGDKVPSLLNGGLTQVWPIYWGAVLAIAGGIELYGQMRQADDDYFPGNLQFDPLGLYPKDEEGRWKMQLAEIKHGRIAMLAIVGFAIQEAVTKIGVVNQTPFFFRPFTELF